MRQIGFKVGTTPGLYGVARTPELASALRKFGFGILKGVDFLESILDVPYEISVTEGRLIREAMQKMGVELAIHGALEVDWTRGERAAWNSARDVVQACIRSAVYAGAKYLLFHASVHRWPETLTAPEIPVVFVMVDELGRHIRDRLKEVRELREWFVERYMERYYEYVMLPEELRKLSSVLISFEWSLRRRLEEMLQRKEITEEEFVRRFEEERTKFYEEERRKLFLKHLEEGKPWFREEAGNPVDIYRIMFKYIFIVKDPILLEMYRMYEQELKHLGLELNFELKDWPERVVEKYEEGFKVCGDFYHAAVAAKYVEGQLKLALQFLEKELMEEFKKLPAEEREELEGIAKELKFTIETPFMGGVYAGMMTFWHPRQIYAFVKAARQTLKTDKIYMTIDFEHHYVEGVDPWEEIPRFAKLAPDAGRYIISLHVTKPTPLHHHIEVEIGDVEVYKLLWHLRLAGLGKYHLTYLIFERGGEEEPYKHSVVALKLMAEFLEKEIPPEKLVEHPEFFGIYPAEIAAVERQLAIVREHAYDPLKPLRKEGAA